MKQLLRITLAVVAVMSMLPAFARIDEEGKIMGRHDLNIMYSNFSFDKNAQFYFYEEEDGVYSFTFVDSKLNEIAKVTTQKYPTVEATYTRWVAGEAPIGIYVTNTEETDSSDFSEEEFIEYAKEVGYTRIENTNSEIRYYSENLDDYYCSRYYGFKYPKDYLAWRDGKAWLIEVTYNYTEMGMVWSDGEEVNSSVTPELAWMDYYIDGYTDDGYFSPTITQTLFNNDEAYEWIIPIYEVKEYKYENSYTKGEGNYVYCTGFKVMSSNGTTVSTVNFPNGYDYSSLVLDLYVLGSDTYLCCKVSDSEDNYYSIFYSILPDENAVKQVGEPRRVSVRPTALNHGTPVTVTLPNESMNVTNVKVVSLSGAVVMSRNMQPNENSISLETSSWAPGVYVVNVTDGKTTREASKIIVR